MTRAWARWFRCRASGNPLVNELVIGLKDKDRFNASEPKDDAQFATYVTNPTLPALIQALFGVTAPTTPRDDLVQGIPDGRAWSESAAACEACGNAATEYRTMPDRSPGCRRKNRSELSRRGYLRASGTAAVQVTTWSISRCGRLRGVS